eukprot:gene2352-2576_t
MLSLLSAIAILSLISLLPIHGRRLRHHDQGLTEENPLLLHNTTTTNNTTTILPTPTNPTITGSPPCIPISGKTALIIGEDYNSIKNYSQAFPSHSQPFGLMSYTALSNDYGHLTGLRQPIDYGSGIQWVDGLTSLYPTSAIQLGLWIKGQLDGIIQGEYDNEINALANYINETLTHAFYLRIGYEFDSLENNYDNRNYQLSE